MNRRHEMLARLLMIQEASERLSEMAEQQYPHDLYKQTVYVMGYDPLGEMSNEIERQQKQQTALANSR